MPKTNPEFVPFSRRFSRRFSRQRWPVLGGAIVCVLFLLTGACASPISLPAPSLPGSVQADSVQTDSVQTDSTQTMLRWGSITATLPDGWTVEEMDGTQATLLFNADSPPLEIQVTLSHLTFEGNGNTFLSTIEDEAQQRPPSERHFLTRPDGLITGEILRYDDELVAYYQPPSSGSEEGLRMQGVKSQPVQRLMTEMTLSSETSTPGEDVTIEAVRATRSGESTWQFQVTLLHPDTGWADYTDGWQIATPDGQILGTRILLHPHENEQPFTRSLQGVSVPDDLAEVHIVAHDLVSGYSTAPFVVSLPNPSGQ